MEADKRRRLEARGWRVGTVKEFLGLSPADAELIEIKLSLSRELVERRKRLGYTQEKLAKEIRSSQSRVAKMEAGDPSVSLDLLVRALLMIGTKRADLSRAMLQHVWSHLTGRGPRSQTVQVTRSSQVR